jgi:hypothetical protein
LFLNRIISPKNIGERQLAATHFLNLLEDDLVLLGRGYGSTIGLITATNLGIKTLNIGAPTFAMHSIRETCGEDIWYLYKALKKTFETS